MMDKHSAKPVGPDDTPGSTAGRKLGTSAQQPPEQGLKCPRCDSPNTKFCYYNNYSLTQPRHFCKTCRRYWTKGGALRNVPIGGGCRKSKKSKSSSNLSSSSSKDTASNMSTDSIIGGTASSSGLKFIQHGGLSPTMEFHLGGLPFSRLHSPAPGAFNHFFSFGDLSSTATLSTNSPSAFEPVVPGNSASLMGLNYPISPGIFSSAIQEMGSSASSSSSSLHMHSSLASSIESLSCINQDLHWKLQQQRLGLLFGGENQKDSSVSAVQASLLENQRQPISFRAPDSLKTEACGSNSRKVCAGDNASEWFFGSSYGAGNGNSSNNNTGSWNEIQTWNDLHQYSALP